jgi:hypothetical protein
MFVDSAQISGESMLTRGEALMRPLVWLLATGIALGLASPAAAGCWATAGLSPLPNVSAGETWIANVRVLKHGNKPLVDAKPAVLAENAATGERLTFPASLVDPIESRFRAEVIFPSAGSWSVAVDDGFPWAECARTHTFGTHAIGAGTAPAAPLPPAEADLASPDPAASPQPPSAADGGEASFILPLGLGLGLAALAIAAIWTLVHWRGRLLGRT